MRPGGQCRKALHSTARKVPEGTSSAIPFFLGNCVTGNGLVPTGRLDSDFSTLGLTRMIDL